MIFYHHVTFDTVSWPVWAGERVKEKFRLILFRHKTRLPDPNCSVGTRVLNCAPTREERLVGNILTTISEIDKIDKDRCAQEFQNRTHATWDWQESQLDFTLICF